MKILVPVKRVLDYNLKVRVAEDGSGVDIEQMKMAMNPFDEVSVEEALRLKEKDCADEVIVVSIGPAKARDTITAALAMGADRGIHLLADAPVESLGVALILAHLAEREKTELVIVGKQAIDTDNNFTGQMLAAKLGWGQATFISSLTLGDGTLEAVREIDGGMMRVSMRLPAVVTTDLRLNEPRYASLPNIMRARKKPIEEISAGSLGLDLERRHEVLKVTLPPERPEGVRLDTVEALVDRLKNEAGVLS